VLFRSQALDCSNLELVIFRVVQEWLIYLGRYAEPAEVELTVVFHETYVEVDLFDQGKGFEIDKIPDLDDSERNSACYGIAAMQERIGLLNGGIAICSRPEEGTAISLFLPF